MPRRYPAPPVGFDKKRGRIAADAAHIIQWSD